MISIFLEFRKICKANRESSCRYEKCARTKKENTSERICCVTYSSATCSDCAKIIINYAMKRDLWLQITFLGLWKDLIM